MQILTCLGLLILSVVGPALATPPSGDVFVASKDGTSIYANAAGNPANPAVVFVHALGYSSVGFDDYFEDHELLKQLYMVRYDLRGFGRSDHPKIAEAYEGHHYAEDFAAVCQRFGIERVVYTGWSMGAFLFPDVIQTIPSSIKVLGMVNLAAAPDFVSRDKLTLSGDALNLYAAALTPGASAEVYRQGMFAFPQFLWAHPEQVPHRKQMLALGVAMQAEADLVFPIMQARKQNATRFWEEGREGLPVLLIWGRKDNVFDAPKIEGVYRDHEWKKLDVLAVDDAGHAVHDDGGKVASYHIMEFVLRVALA